MIWQKIPGRPSWGNRPTFSKLTRCNCWQTYSSLLINSKPHLAWGWLTMVSDFLCMEPRKQLSTTLSWLMIKKPLCHLRCKQFVCENQNRPSKCCLTLFTESKTKYLLNWIATTYLKLDKRSRLYLWIWNTWMLSLIRLVFKIIFFCVFVSWWVSG